MKILQADDHPLFRDGIRHLLAELSDERIDVVESFDFASTIQRLEENDDIDLVLLDLGMPGMETTRGLRRLVEMFPSIPFVVLSASDRAQDIDSSLAFGAAGFVPKSSPSRILLAALKLVLEGGTYAPRTGRRAGTAGWPNESAIVPTRRQLEILRCIAEGMPNKAIARQLCLAESTIKGHVGGLLQILDVDNRVQAINKARELGYLARY